MGNQKKIDSIKIFLAFTKLISTDKVTISLLTEESSKTLDRIMDVSKITEIVPNDLQGFYFKISDSKSFVNRRYVTPKFHLNDIANLIPYSRKYYLILKNSRRHLKISQDVYKYLKELLNIYEFNARLGWRSIPNISDIIKILDSVELKNLEDQARKYEEHKNQLASEQLFEQAANKREDEVEAYLKIPQLFKREIGNKI